MKRIVVACLAAVVACAAAVHVDRAAAAARLQPVPSLTPAVTQTLWRRLVERRRLNAPRRASDCRPARVVVYAQTDWLRVATLLAQNASPCAQYYVSVPPIATNKAQPRAGQAAKIRALGPNMHALAEISWNGWAQWVAANQSNWAQAGIVARQRMAAAGYDVAAGDTWAVNELSSALRANTGLSRQNVRDFVRGLFTGDGTLPQAKGVVFVIGMSQSVGDVSAYKANLESWFQDAPFWSDIGSYVSDWGQEVYGDIRDYAVAGTSAQQRRDALEQFLGHPLLLARAAPPQAGSAATSVLDAIYLPLANAAWAWGAAYGFTSVPYQQMQDYVSAQVYAERALAAATDASVDRIGFAWAPTNTLGLAPGDFANQTAAILQRLGQAISDSAATLDPNDPGVGACGPLGQPTWCSTVVPGGAFPAAWSTFATWTPATVAFAAPAASATAGQPVGPLSVQLQTGGAPTVANAPTAVTLTTTSPRGAFATGPAGPWTPSLVLTIPPGSGSASFYYQDTRAGTATLTAAVPGQAGATETVTVAAGPPTALSITAPSSTVLQDARLPLTATATDAYGNAFPVAPAWSVTPPALGLVETANGVSTFVPGHATGRGKVVATLGSVSSSRTVVVKLPPPRVASATTRFVHGYLVATVKVLAGTLPARRVPLTLRVRKGSSTVAAVSGRTDAQGLFRWRSAHRLPHGRYVATATLRR